MKKKPLPKTPRGWARAALRALKKAHAEGLEINWSHTDLCPATYLKRELGGIPFDKWCMVSSMAFGQFKKPDDTWIFAKNHGDTSYEGLCSNLRFFGYKPY